jgi:hypothetical protein|tara:strand:- start:900 stop:1079 length:180 start_codon:yes stop_codon:yes gene_type:complete
MFNKEVIESGNKLYLVIRKIHMQHNPIVNNWKEHLRADRVFKREPYFYFVKDIIDLEPN